MTIFAYSKNSRRLSQLLSHHCNKRNRQLMLHHFGYIDIRFGKMLSTTVFLLLFVVFGTCLADDDGNCPNIIQRAKWGAKNAKSVSYLIRPLPYVVFHHSVTPECFTFTECSTRIQSIQRYHMANLNFHDGGYSFYIGGDGNVYEGVGWNKEGSHTYGWNKKSAGIVFIGNFQNTEPTYRMMIAARKLVDCGKSEGSLRDDFKIFGARQLSNTLSPGEKLYSKIQNWPEFGTPLTKFKSGEKKLS